MAFCFVPQPITLRGKPTVKDKRCNQRLSFTEPLCVHIGSCKAKQQDGVASTEAIKEVKTMANTEITFEIKKHIGIIDTYDNREQAWTKEVNIVSWNGGIPKIDIRDWDCDHERMSRGITLTEEQGQNLVKALSEHFKA